MDVRQAAGDEAGVFLEVLKIFCQSQTNALRQTAVDLAVDNTLIGNGAKITDMSKLDYFRFACLDVYFDFRHEDIVHIDRERITLTGYGIAGCATPDGQTAFRMTAERMGRLFAAPFANKAPGAEMPSALSGTCNDGPMPEFYEPIESPTPNLLHPKVATNPVARVRKALAGKQELGKVEQYPYVLTTYASGVEHFCSGSLTRNLPWLVEVMPEAFIEIGTALAKKLDIKYGEIVEVVSARGSIKLKALVTDRIQPLTINGKETHTVGIPFGWGFAGLATGPSVNALTHAAFDPPAGTPEYKALLVNVRKVK